ncbi:hypothetical protein BEH_24240 [Priestia filamentosa]|uniref:Transglycosylase SLT domain-containing protein n=1 Tax=Priestia filamentosa TaxID=1402861 RepID=A0A2S1LZB5_9BACI|nr:lytic transglycosylase domain-containing protein [Priestia filamentosa]AWG44164.1 hypothetical protein BEH_24240 [Priestia filamentosa]
MGLVKEWAGKYAEEINYVANKHGVDPLLVASIIKAESNFSEKAESYAGSKGLMQIYPSTFRKYIGDGDVFDIRDNIECGVRYLKDIVSKVGSDIFKVAMAANVGANSVVENRDILNSTETKAYVKRVVDSYQKYIFDEVEHKRDSGIADGWVAISASEKVKVKAGNVTGVMKVEDVKGRSILNFYETGGIDSLTVNEFQTAKNSEEAKGIFITNSNNSLVFSMDKKGNIVINADRLATKEENVEIANYIVEKLKQDKKD